MFGSAVLSAARLDDAGQPGGTTYRPGVLRETYLTRAAIFGVVTVTSPHCARWRSA